MVNFQMTINKSEIANLYLFCESLGLKNTPVSSAPYFGVEVFRYIYVTSFF